MIQFEWETIRLTSEITPSKLIQKVKMQMIFLDDNNRLWEYFKENKYFSYIGCCLKQK